MELAGATERVDGTFGEQFPRDTRSAEMVEGRGLPTDGCTTPA